MLRDLLKEGGLYTVANLLTSGISLLLIPFYTVYFLPSEYGIIGIIGVFGAFFNAFVSLQLGQGLARYVGDGKLNEEEKKRYGSTAIFFTILLYLVFGLLVFFFDDFFVKILSSDVPIPTYLFDLAILSIVTNSIFYAQGVYFRFLRKSKTFTILSFFHALTNILLTLLFVLGMDLGIYGIFYAAIIVAPLLVIIQSYFLRNHLRVFIGSIELSMLLEFSVPLVPAGISYVFLNFTDRLFINEYLDSAQLGVYEVAFKFSSVVTLIIAGFSMAITPLIYEKHHLASTNTEIARIAKLFFSIGTLGVLTVAVFSLETLQLFTTPSYYGAANVMPLLYTSVLFTGIWMFAPGLNIEKRTSITAVVVIISSAINIGLNFILMQHYQLLGAAFSTLISVAINNIVLYYLANKYYRIDLPYLKIAVVFILFGVFLFAGGYWIYNFELSWWLVILVKVGILALYLLLIIRLGLFDLSYFQKLKLLLTHAKKS